MTKNIFLSLLLSSNAFGAGMGPGVGMYAPSTLFILREETVRTNDEYNDAVQEIENKLTGTLSASDRLYYNTRLAILFLINDTIVDCLAAKILEQLDPEEKTAETIKRIKAELSTVDVQKPVYIESKFQRNRAATGKEYNALEHAGVNLQQLREKINTFISCADFNDLVQPRKRAIFSGSRFYLDLNKINALNSYLKFVEPTIALLSASEKTPAEKQATLSALGVELQKAKVTTDLNKRFSKIAKEILNKPVTAEDVLSFAISVRALRN